MFLGATEIEVQSELDSLKAELASITAQRQQVAAESFALQQKIAAATAAKLVTPLQYQLPTGSPGLTSTEQTYVPVTASSAGNIITQIEQATGLPWYVPVGGGLVVLLLLLRR